MPVRAFIAINLPADLKDSLESKLLHLKKISSGAKWVRKENLHITLKFLGTTEEAQIAAITDVLQEVSLKYKSFEIAYEETGGFPNIRRPKVIWIGIRDKSALIEIGSEIEEKLEKLGFPKESRKFSPHLTVARVKEAKNYSSLEKKLKELEKIEFGTMTANSIALMKSDLEQSGAKYSIIEEFRLLS